MKETTYNTTGTQKTDKDLNKQKQPFGPAGQKGGTTGGAGGTTGGTGGTAGGKQQR